MSTNNSKMATNKKKNFPKMMKTLKDKNEIFFFLLLKPYFFCFSITFFKTFINFYKLQKYFFKLICFIWRIVERKDSNSHSQKHSKFQNSSLHFPFNYADFCMILTSSFIFDFNNRQFCFVWLKWKNCK